MYFSGKAIERTGSEWETEDNFKKNCYLVKTKDKKIDHAGVVLDAIDENTLLVSPDEYHAMIIGTSGNGKSRRVIIPTIKTLSKRGDSMVISDPKGELFRYTASALRDKGYRVKSLDLRNPRRGDRWNPFYLIEKYYHSDDMEKQDRALIMLKDVGEILKLSISSDKDKYWENAAISLFMACSYILLDYGNPGSLNFKNISKVCELLTRSGGGENIRNTGRKFQDFLESLPSNSEIKTLLITSLQNSNNTASCIINIFNVMLSSFVDQRAIVDLLSTNEIDLGKISTEPTALFLILPDESVALYGIASILVSQVYSELLYVADNSQNGKLVNPVSFLLDEFGSFTEIPSFPAMMTAGRSRGIRFVLALQNYAQLKFKYNENDALTIFGNCKTLIYMGGREYSFMAMLSDLIGEHIMPYSGDRYPLVSLQELQSLELGEIIVLNGNSRPYCGRLLDFTSYNWDEDLSVDSYEKTKERELLDKSIFDLKAVLSN